MLFGGAEFGGAAAAAGFERLAEAAAQVQGTTGAIGTTSDTVVQSPLQANAQTQFVCEQSFPRCCLQHSLLTGLISQSSSREGWMWLATPRPRTSRRTRSSTAATGTASGLPAVAQTMSSGQSVAACVMMPLRMFVTSLLQRMQLHKLRAHSCYPVQPDCKAFIYANADIAALLDDAMEFTAWMPVDSVIALRTKLVASC
jgi:hypothetical protein